MLCQLLHLLSQEILIRIVKKERLRSLFFLYCFYQVHHRCIHDEYCMDSWNESAARDCMYPASTLTCDLTTGTERTWLRR